MYALQLTESLCPAQTDDDVIEQSVGGLLREIAARHPSAEALVEVDMDGRTDRTWTYGELLADSERLAMALSTRFSPGERITVWAPNIPEWLLMEYACALSGIILVTANPAYQAKELRYVLEQSGSAALFLVESFRGNPMSEIAIWRTTRRFIASAIDRPHFPTSGPAMRCRFNTRPGRPVFRKAPSCPIAV